MATMTVADLLSTLRSLHLLEPAQLAKLAELQAKLPEPQPLAKKLISHGWLTPFQVNLLLQGRGKELLLDSYVLIERIGEGGMGEVYKAKNWKMGRIVALKVIKKDRLKSDNAARRFHREVQAVSKLKDPNIVMAYDAGQAGDTHFFAMEFVDGVDLARLVKQNGPLPVAQACEYIRQAACGLAHAHEKGMVHRDIKPSNLLVTKAQGAQSVGVIKILDMGLALTDDADETSTLTQEGSVLGTLDYLSPEQALNAHKADVRSDLYSLGCTFYFLLTGKVPYGGGSATEKLLKHRLEEPTPLEQLRKGIPPQVAEVVRKLMAKRPEDRYQTPAELAAALAGGPSKITAAAPIPSRAGAAPLDSSPTMGADGQTVPSATRLAGRAKLSPKLLLGLGVGCGSLALLLGMCLVSAALLAPSKESGTAPGVVKGTGKTTKSALSAAQYTRMPTREETILATLKSGGYPTLQGTWHCLGYFDFNDKKGPDASYFPEKDIDLTRTFTGKGNQSVSWQEYKFVIGTNNHLNELMAKHWFANLGAATYLYHVIETSEPLELPVAFGGEDVLLAWLNGERVFARIAPGPFAPEQNVITLRLKPGKNELLLKSCNGLGKNSVYVCPQWPTKLEEQFGAQLSRDFRRKSDRPGPPPDRPEKPPDRSEKPPDRPKPPPPDFRP